VGDESSKTQGKPLQGEHPARRIWLKGCERSEQKTLVRAQEVTKTWPGGNGGKIEGGGGPFNKHQQGVRHRFKGKGGKKGLLGGKGDGLGKVGKKV